MAVIEEELKTYAAGASVQVVNEVPDTLDIPAKKTEDGKTVWKRVRCVTCVYVDMRNSTGLSAAKNDSTTARCTALFVETAVRMFHAFEAAYIDVSGDGVFGLYDEGEPHRALAAAVSFKTFINNDFKPRLAKSPGVDVGVHIGVDARTVLVRKLGLRPRDGRTDRQNEVWAGRPVNMAAKLASLASDKEVFASERFWKLLKDSKALQSCGCGSEGPSDLWTTHSLENDDRFDFDLAYVLRSDWCEIHGAEFCEALFGADSAE